MKARHIKEIGTVATLRLYWGDACPGPWGCHNAELPLGRSDKIDDHKAWGSPPDYPAERWPVKCDHCLATPPPEAKHQVFTAKLYDTASGHPEPGDLFERECYAQTRWGRCAWGWTNCTGRHLIGILPNGHEWDICSRCSNCTMRDDNTHRCWIVSGEPPAVDVGKGGHTCAAGAGSIGVPGWHGFLRSGVWVEC